MERGRPPAGRPLDLTSTCGGQVELRSRFIMQLRRMDTGRVLDLPPNRVADAARTVLGLPGAGIVMMHRLVRLPVGAAGPHVAVAEQLQATLGLGPCVTSAELGEPLACTEQVLVERWPLYHAELVRRTPYRSTLSFPLKRSDGAVFAAMDAYSTHAIPEMEYPLEQMHDEISDLVAMLLLGAMSDDKHLLTWPPTDELRKRRQVWVAVGMVLEAAHVSDTDALAILRAHAFRTGQLLDDVVEEMLAGHLTTEVLLSAT